MHIISEEKALSQWEMLCALPYDKIQLLAMRFMREHRPLAQTLAALSDVPEGLDKPSEDLEEDPRFEEFLELLTRAACLAELFRREAGHSLRQLDDPEIESFLQADMERARKTLESPSLTQPTLIATSAQPNLLGGIAIGLLSLEKPSGKAASAFSVDRLIIEMLHRACGDAPADPNGDWDAERILVALSAQGDPLRREALDATESFRTELTPMLIHELESAAAEPEVAIEQDVSVLMHALFLLAKWREDAAWPASRKLFSLPGEMSHDLLGTIVTEEGSILLAMIGDRRCHELRLMIEDEKIDDYCRGACLDALTSLVAWGEMSREEHVTYLRELLTTKLRDVPENDHIFARVVSAACDLGAWDLRPEIEAAFDRGVVDDGFIDLEFFLQSAAGKHRNQWEEFCHDHQPVTDLATGTEWLDEPPRSDEPLPLLGDDPLDEDEHIIAESSKPYIAPPKIGRNDPCPCGSGKKYKKCCGK